MADTSTNQPQPGAPARTPIPAVTPGSSAAAFADAPAGGPGVLVGVDLVEIDRIAQTLERHGPRFLKRLLRPEELQEAEHRRIAWLAGRFAAKEACAKALGAGIGAAVAWHDMQILPQPSGKPSLRLLDGAATRAASLGIAQLDLSISHTHQYAVAVVVALIAGHLPA